VAGEPRGPDAASDPVLNGLQLGAAAVPAGLRADAGLRHPGLRQPRPWRALHAGRVLLRHADLALTGNFLLAVLLALPADRRIAGWWSRRLVARNLYQRDHLDQVLATFGLILVIDTLVHMIWGPEGIAVPLPEG
jgi:hypothetical protein